MFDKIFVCPELPRKNGRIPVFPSANLFQKFEPFWSFIAKNPFEVNIDKSHFIVSFFFHSELILKI